MKKGIAIFSIMGIVYIFVENVYSAFEKLFRTGSLSLIGGSSLWMFVIGGILGVCLGFFNQINWIRRTCNVFAQSLVGALLITIVEFTSGVLLNIVCGFNLWSYATYPLNLLGQICLPMSIAWFLICPLAFWLDDVIRYFLYKEGALYNILDVYKDLFFFWKNTSYQSQL